MSTAAAAAEYRTNIGQDFSMADALDAEYLDADADAEAETATRQALNARMADWYGIG